MTEFTNTPLDRTYEQIYDENIRYLKSNDILIDEYLQKLPEDDRRGLSVIIRPQQSFKPRYESIIAGFREIEGNQYYYPFENLHITIFCFIPAQAGFNPGAEPVQRYEKIFREVFAGEKLIGIDLCGLTFSRSAGFFKGYDHNRLNPLREKIRQRMNHNKLRIRERCKAKTAHITFCRFKNRIEKHKEFLARMERKRYFGPVHLRFNAPELVVHDWYNSKEKCSSLARAGF